MMCALTKFRTQQNNSLLHVFARKVLNNASLRKLSGSVCVCAPENQENISLLCFSNFCSRPTPRLPYEQQVQTTWYFCLEDCCKRKRAETKICQSIHYDLKPIKPPCKVGGPRAVCRRNFSWVDTGDGGGDMNCLVVEGKS